MSILEDYRKEVDDLVKEVHMLYWNLREQNKISLMYHTPFSNFKPRVIEKKCFRFNKRDLNKMEILIGDWINLVNFGVESDYTGVLQNYREKLTEIISYLSPRFFYPCNKNLKNELIKVYKRFDKCVYFHKKELDIKVAKKMPMNLFTKLNVIYEDVKKGDFNNLLYLKNALMEFKMFDPEKFYRAIEEGEKYKDLKTL